VDTLLMPLVGPMQSWGHRSRFDDRDTGLEPTRTGVIGLISAASGLCRNEDLSQFASITMGVRVDVPGRVMVDFQTAMNVAKAGDEHTGTVTSQRHYLSDARFLVGLQSDDRDLLQEIDESLRHPVWSLYLGRKSYVPSLPLFLPGSSIQNDKTLLQALKTYPLLRLTKYEKPSSEHIRLLIEDPQGPIVRSDAPPPTFARRDEFRLRRIRTDWIQVTDLPDGGVWTCISLA
jgi:CRISPR system Cascade subunit CasD